MCGGKRKLMSGCAQSSRETVHARPQRRGDEGEGRMLVVSGSVCVSVLRKGTYPGNEAAPECCWHTATPYNRAERPEKKGRRKPHTESTS